MDISDGFEKDCDVDVLGIQIIQRMRGKTFAAAASQIMHIL